MFDYFKERDDIKVNWLFRIKIKNSNRMWYCHFVRQQKFIDRVEIERYPEAQLYKEIQLNGIVNMYVNLI